MERKRLELSTPSLQSTGLTSEYTTKQGENEHSSERPPVIPPYRQDEPTDPDLAAIIAAWPTLPAAMRAGVLAMVKVASAT